MKRDKEGQDKIKNLHKNRGQIRREQRGQSGSK
jgi:hypothetical protein